MKYYIYKILWYKKCDDLEKTDYGLVAAKNYAEAVENIISDFDEDCVTSLNIKDITDCECKTLTINKAMVKMFKEGHNEKFVESYHLAEKDYKGKAYFDVPVDDKEEE
jgi:hypothetical protein